MPVYDFQTFDVFTAAKFAGNQLAVIMDAQGLTSEQMLAITREFNYAESSFILPPQDPANTAQVRIFTPGYEMPFAGHPTVGTAIAIAQARKIPDEVRLELNAGVFPVAVNMDGKTPYAAFLNPNLPQKNGAAPTPEALEAALGLPDGAIDRAAHKPRRIGAGVDFIFARAPLDAVRGAKVDSTAFEALDLKKTIGVLLYARGGGADIDYHVRMFAPGAGVPEDAGTGSAAAALPGQIALSQEIGDGAHRWTIEQGVEMGRPCRISVRVEFSGGSVRSVRIGGEAVKMQAGQIFV